MKYRFVFVMLAGCLVLGRAYAQNRINQNWYFGDAGLDFGSTPPTLLTNSGMDALTGCTEGSASISDTAGNLLFYTDGDTVYNKNHQPMPNGFDLGGSFSVAQPASIVQWPGMDNRYAIFTTHDPQQHGRYSVVDMNLQNGLGDITDKNVYITDTVMEALLVVPHRDCGRYWVIYKIENTDRFEAYLFDVAGLHPVPVVSHAGTVPPPNARVAYLGGSPDRSLLAFSCVYDTVFSVLRFNDATGEISDLATIALESAYATCFSPDGRLLYIGHARWDQSLFPDAASNLISQYDLSTGQSAAIAASRFTVDSLQSSLNGEFGQMRVGNDGVLYTVRAWSGALGTIGQPNQTGAACQYTRDAFGIAPKNTWLGLPAIAYGNVPATKPQLGPDVYVCQGPVWLAPKNPLPPPYVWNTGSTDSAIAVTESGTYIVHADGCGTPQSDTVQVSIQQAAENWTVPNIFTPNNDGVNDFISPLVNGCDEADFRIYNRWGNLVYTYASDTPVFAGNTDTGAGLSPGVYFYVYSQGQQKRQGSITLIR